MKLKKTPKNRTSFMNDPLLELTWTLLTRKLVRHINARPIHHHICTYWPDQYMNHVCILVMAHIRYNLIPSIHGNIFRKWAKKLIKKYHWTTLAIDLTYWQWLGEVHIPFIQSSQIAKKKEVLVINCLLNKTIHNSSNKYLFRYNH